MSTPYPPTTFLRQRDGASAIALTWAEHWELLWDGYKPVNGTPDFPVGEVEQRVPKAVVDAKGDLLVGLAADAVGRLAAGANGRQLFADSAQETGLRWGADGEHVTAANVGAVNVNTLITAGSYYVSSSATNTPTAANGFVRVSRIGVAVSQEFVGVTGTPIATWTRRSVDTGATWTAWVETAAKSAVDAKANKAGDTFTGTVVFEPGAGQAFLRVIRPDLPDADRRWQGYVGPDGSAYLRSVGPGDVLQNEPMRLYRNGRVDLGAIGFIRGTGMPEGVVSAPVGSRYIDTAATNGAVEWIKASGTGNTGWRVVYGDTGARNVTGLLSSLDPANTGLVRLRRENNIVTWSFSSVLLAGGSGTATFWTNVTFGFRAHIAGDTGYAGGDVFRHNSLGSAQRIVAFGASIAWLCETTVGSPGTPIRPSVPITGQISYRTDSTWPSVLPGTAA